MNAAELHEMLYDRERCPLDDTRVEPFGDTDEAGDHWYLLCSRPAGPGGEDRRHTWPAEWARATVAPKVDELEEREGELRQVDAYRRTQDALTPRQREILQSAAGMTRSFTPLQMGGGSHTHHSATMRQLVTKGLLTARPRSHGMGERGSNQYDTTPAGEWIGKNLNRLAKEARERERREGSK